MLLIAYFFPSFFGLYLIVKSEEEDRKYKERDKGYDMHKGPWPDSNQGRCSYVACTLTIQPTEHSDYVCLCHPCTQINSSHRIHALVYSFSIGGYVYMWPINDEYITKVVRQARQFKIIHPGP